MLNWCKVNVSDSKATLGDFLVKVIELSSKYTFFCFTIHTHGTYAAD